MVGWAKAKVQEIYLEVAELQVEYDYAKKNKWRTSGLKNALNRTKKRHEFYEKVKLALEAGYALVPNFPVDVFAIRTCQESPFRPANPPTRSDSVRECRTDSSPPGEGEYKDTTPAVVSYLETVKDNQGKEKEVQKWYPTDFLNVEFPVQLAKVEVMEAASRAMALKIFDEIGALPARPGRIPGTMRRRGDPIVVGRIVQRNGYQEKVLSFMIAWFMNFDML
jgi:hypothetical protein